MGTRGFIQRVAAIVVSVAYPTIASAGAYSLTAAGERLEFVPQAEKGYVIKLAERPGGITALRGLAIPDGDEPRPLGGRDRRSVWTVENEGPAAINERTMATLRQQARVAYVAPLFSSNGTTVAIIPEIVIRVEPGVAIDEVQTLCETAGCTIRKRMEFTEQEYLLDVLDPDAEAVFAALEQLNQAPEVEWACPNTALQPKWPDAAPSADKLTMPVDSAPAGPLRIASAGEDVERTGIFPNDPYFPRQWHLCSTGQSGGTPGVDIRAPEAWEITTGDPNTTVAVIDNGVDSNQPDLVDNLVPGYDFLDNDDQPNPALGHWFNGHGTCCAGLIAAQGNNGIGLSGVTWNCRLMPIRRAGVRADGGAYSTTSADTATAFRWAASHGADIFSDSWSGYSSVQPIVQSAIADVTKLGGIGRNGKGCVLLAAVGNKSSAIAKYPDVIAVGATDHNDVRCSYSNYGPALAIMAPGAPTLDWEPTQGRGWIWTTDIAGMAGYFPYPPYLDISDYALLAGTSASCPIAAGVAALILSIEPSLTGGEVRHFLERSAKDLGEPGRDDYYGWGRVDARAALDMVLAYRCDLNRDWKVDEQDLAILNVAIDANDLSGDIAPAKKRDGIVDANDLGLLTQYLGTEIPELGSVARWKLDETEGVTAYDCINHRDGTLHGGAVWQPDEGMIDGALGLDGIDGYVSTGYVLSPATGPFSAFAWIKGGTAGQTILSQANGRNWLSTDAATGALTTELTVGLTIKPLVSQVVVTDGDWHRVGVSWDRANLVLYVDDAEVAGKAQSSVPSSSNGLYLGAGSKLAVGTFWSGLIDDVRIYDRAVKP